uniref:Ribonuclease A-domain domain-containing protein n=1 Tax=Chelydra serpentina TaxID=8475 RepID=A0A8C3S9X4_CHESE
MALRGLHLAILLPHILLAGSLGQFGETDSYKKFMNQHFDYPKTSDTENKTYCNYMMSKRGMTYDSCKHINTFIHAPESDIKAICHSKGIRDTGNIYNSTGNFRLTTCQLNTTNSSESCTYMEIEETSKIRVACDNRQLYQAEPWMLLLGWILLLLPAIKCMIVNAVWLGLLLC